MSEEKYGITDAHYLCDSAIFNTETNEILRLYQICEMLNQQDAKIADLEAKLAESEKEKDYYQDLYFTSVKGQEELKQQLAEKEKTISNLIEDSRASKELLKEQLAEKEKEIERLNLEFQTQEDWQEKWQKLYDKTCNLDQSKTEFAIQQLQRVKEFVNNYIAERNDNLFLWMGYMAEMPHDKLDEFIDQIIAEIKGQQV